MKKIIILLLIGLTSTFSLFGYSNQEFVKVSPQLKPTIEKLLKYPKARKLLSDAQRQGPISVKYERFHISTSNAMWNAGTRTIILNSDRQRSEGEAIRSIIFELHNAKNNPKFQAIDNQARMGQIDKTSYVRGIEKIEHQNALEAEQLLNEAIYKGYYPQTARWPIIHDFEAHYRLQQEVGHSQFIANAYDQMNPYAYQGLPY